MKDERVLYRPNEQVQLEVQLKDETVWLNVNQIALLFDRDRMIERLFRGIYATYIRRANWMKISHVQNLHTWVWTPTKYMKPHITTQVRFMHAHVVA